MTPVAVALAGLLAAAAAAGAAPVQEPPGKGVAELLGASLVPSPEDEKLLREQAVAEEIARTLRLVPGVTAARVHVRLAEKGLLVRSESKPGAVAVVRVDERNPDVATLREIVRAAAPGAAAEDVRVIAVAERAPAARSDGSLERLKIALAVAFSLVAALSVGLIATGVRLRRSRALGRAREADDAAQQEEEHQRVEDRPE
jgi:type III secretory pathway lipoprotein EscJ